MSIATHCIPWNADCTICNPEPILGSRDEDDTRLTAPVADSRDTEAEPFDDALTRYLRQGYLDTMDDPLDEYGKRIVRRLQTLYRASVPEGTND